MILRDEGAEHAVWFGRRPTPALGSIYEFDTAVIRFRYLPHRRRRRRSSTTTWTPAHAPCASRRGSRAATINRPMWCDDCRSPPSTTSRCRSPCCTAGTCRSTVQRRSISKATAPIRSPSRGIRLEGDVPAGRSRVRLCDRARSRRTGEGRALAQRRTSGKQDQYLRGFHRSRGVHDQGRLQRSGTGRRARGDSAGGLLMGAVATCAPTRLPELSREFHSSTCSRHHAGRQSAPHGRRFSRMGDPIRDVGVYRRIARYSRTTMSPRTLIRTCS